MVQDITRESYGSRIIKSILGVFIGILLILGAFFVIFWNEIHGLHVAESLQQTLAVVITVPNSPIDPNNNLKVIHSSGTATTNDVLQDPFFGLSENALTLKRKVEMYQWKENKQTETKKEFGGAETTTTTYTYEPAWANSHIDSSKFKEPTGHENPVMPIKTFTSYAQKITVGDFVLPNELIHEISGETPVNLSKIDLTVLKNKLNKSVENQGDYLYVGEDPDAPKIGDLKITIIESLQQPVSFIGQQTGDTLQAYIPPAKQPVLLLGMGTQSPQQLIQTAQEQNKIVTWIIRLFSFLMLFIGFSLLLKPLAVIVDVVPFFGNLVDFGIGFAAFISALIVWALATAFSWVAVRPMGAIGLIVVAIALCYFLYSRRKKQTSP